MPGRIRSENEERSRESLYNALVNALNETIECIKKERQRLLFSGAPWQPRKNDQVKEMESARGVKDTTKNECPKIDSPSKKLSVLKGGLYEPVAPKEIDGGLSDTFRAFLYKERAKTDHHENT